MANKETKRLGNKGFSLVELIVVIAIMAVLVGVLAPQFIKYVEKSRESTDITNLDSIKQVVESYYADKEGGDLPEKVTVDGSSGTYTCSATFPSGSTNTSGDVSATVLKQGGVEGTAVKGSRWDTEPKFEWDIANNSWKYYAESAYYTDGNAGQGGTAIKAK